LNQLGEGTVRVKLAVVTSDHRRILFVTYKSKPVSDFPFLRQSETGLKTVFESI